mmetsp:Transcript_29808/g.65138  ORF Transcript_29808/g.65138 Transcript_29808/m.65138 type:complete len:257 (+) Transcript_29808:93-863(+)
MHEGVGDRSSRREHSGTLHANAARPPQGGLHLLHHVLRDLYLPLPVRRLLLKLRHVRLQLDVVHRLGLLGVLLLRLERLVLLLRLHALLDDAADVLLEVGQLLRALRRLLAQKVALCRQVTQLLLQVVQHLDSFASGELQPEQLIVALLNLFQILLILNLQLVEVDHVEHLAHLLFLLQLLFHLGDLVFKCGIFQPQLFNHCVLRTRTPLNVSQHLLCHRFTGSEVLCPDHDVAFEFICILFRLCNPQIGLLHHCP